MNKKLTPWVLALGVSVIGWALNSIHTASMQDIKMLERKVHALDVKTHVLENELKKMSFSPKKQHRGLYKSDIQ